MSDNTIRDHLQTIADEATGPHPVLDAVALCDEIERALTTGRLEREKLRAEVARLRAIQDAAYDLALDARIAALAGEEVPR